MAGLFGRKTSVEEEREKEKEYAKRKREREEYKEYLEQFGYNPREYELDFSEDVLWKRICSTM